MYLWWPHRTLEVREGAIAPLGYVLMVVTPNIRAIPLR